MTVSGHPEINQIQVHPGGGRHGGAYIKISTNNGIVKIIGNDYQFIKGENVRIYQWWDH